jgi:predicted kinase
MKPNNLLIMLVGLPRSGKTTWAQRQGHPIVNPDAIRLALHGHAYIKESESIVWAVARYMVVALFGAGHDTVILDACNNTRKRRDTWADDAWSREFVVFGAPKDVCIARVRKGCGRFGENGPTGGTLDNLDIAGNLIEMIERMANQHEPVDRSEGPSYVYSV